MNSNPYNDEDRVVMCVSGPSLTFCLVMGMLKMVLRKIISSLPMHGNKTPTLKRDIRQRTRAACHNQTPNPPDR